MDTTTSHRWSALGRMLCLAVVAAVLSGCIIVPAHPYHHGYYYYR